MTTRHLATPWELPFNTFTAKAPLTGRVLSSTLLTAEHRMPWTETRHIVIQAPGLAYVAGQSIGILPPGIDPRTNRPYALRLYSVASSGKGDEGKNVDPRNAANTHETGEHNTVSIVVARHFWDNHATGEKSIPGVCSNYLCDAKPGDELKLTGPVGKRFLLPVDFMDRDFVFLATGTGVAPFRGMLADMYNAGYGNAKHTASLVFGVPYADSILYDHEFKRLQRHHNFNYVTAISRCPDRNCYTDLFPTRDDKVYTHIALWHHRERIAPAILKPETVVYLCGLRGMESGIQDVISKMGEDAGQPHLVTQMVEEGRLLREVY